MFCPSCGNQIPDNARFCDHCGADTQSKQASSSQQQTGTTPPKGGETPSGEPKTSQTSHQSGLSSFKSGAFDPVRWLSEAWKIIQADLANVVIFNLVYVVVAAILAVTVVGVFIVPGLYAGYMLSIIKYVRDKAKLDPVEMLQSGWQYWGVMLVYWLVMIVLTGIASICLVIPGLIVGMGFVIPAFMIVDKKADFTTTFNKGIELISKQFVGLLIFAAILIAMGIIVAIASAIFSVLGGIVAFVLSLFVVPLVVIASFLAYEELYGTKKAA